MQALGRASLRCPRYGNHCLPLRRHFSRPSLSPIRLSHEQRVTVGFCLALHACAVIKRPRGPMDKASAHGAGDCRFESCRGHFSSQIHTVLVLWPPRRFRCGVPDVCNGSAAPWPNGQGIGPRSRGLQVRVLPGSFVLEKIRWPATCPQIDDTAWLATLWWQRCLKNVVGHSMLPLHVSE